MNNPTANQVRLPHEQETIRAKCFHPTGTFVEFRKEEIEQSIPERFEKTVRLYPEQLALKARGCSLTYQALNQTANRIAHAILVQRGQGEKAVALLFDQGAPLSAALFGVLKAGKFYVLLNPSLPQARLNFMLEDSQSSLLVTSSEHLSLARGFDRKGLGLINVDDLDSSLATKNPGISISPIALTWISYTSGSTGQPKGVVQNHRNLLHLVMTQTNDLHICPQDRLLTLASAGGDTLLAVLNGAAIFPANIKQEGLASVGDWMIQEEITVYNSVPSVFRHFVNTLRGDETFSKLRLIRLTGESVYRRDVELYRKHFPKNCIIVNRLSSSEAPTFRQYFINHSTSITDSVVPVGYAVADNEILLLGDDGKEVDANEIGEIAVKSRHLSPGYWLNPDLTRAKFLPAPGEEEKRIYRTGDLGRMRPDGCLVYFGRKDFQVKIRGNRVELAEIERGLLSLGGFDEAAVVALKDPSGEQRLVAYLVPTNQTPVTVSALRRSLSEKLPDHMIPSAFVMLAALPCKVDRQALPVPVQVRPELDIPFAAPRAPFEATVAGIWANTLGLDQVGIHDEFFDLGGHSLAAMRIVSQIIKTFHSELPVKALFESPTVADMALVIAQNQAKNVGDEEFARMLRELEAMSEDEARKQLAGATKKPEYTVGTNDLAK